MPGWYYKPDCKVVQGEEEYAELPRGLKALTNPTLIAEVLSPSTHTYDLGAIFWHYRHIPSLEQILLIDSTRMYVGCAVPRNGRRDWSLRDFTRSEDEVPILQEGEISLARLYQNLKLNSPAE